MDHPDFFQIGYPEDVAAKRREDNWRFDEIRDMISADVAAYFKKLAEETKDDSEVTKARLARLHTDFVNSIDFQDDDELGTNDLRPIEDFSDEEVRSLVAKGYQIIDNHGRNVTYEEYIKRKGK